MSYEWVKYEVIRFLREREAAEKPRLTIVSNETGTNQREIPMQENTDQPAVSVVSAVPAAPAVPLHEHGALDDMEAAHNLLTLGVDALKGIGTMMRPDGLAGDGQLMSTTRGDISAIFEFFAEVLREPLGSAKDSAWRLGRAAQGKDV